MDSALDSFSARWTQLGIEETAHLIPGDTITADTIADLHGTSSDGKSVLPIPASTLPVLSIGAAGTIDEVGPDLVIGDLLGAGGMGQVHVARQRSLGREVAIKRLRPGVPGTSTDSLVSEAMMTGFLSHPGIIPVHSLGLDETEQPVIVMKRIDGVPWSKLIYEPDNPAWEAWESRAGGRVLAHLEILSQICDALHFAHSQGVVHRDIKPDNVMLGRFGEVYLVDWGVATHVSSQLAGTLVGTPALMAPEMVFGTEVDARTDVYLLGATLHEALTATSRHSGATVRDALQAAIESQPAVYSPAIPVELADLCNLATAKDPAERPASAEVFRQAIGQYLRHRSSIVLSDAAAVRLEELEAVLAGDTTGEHAQFAFKANTFAAEAKFGFTQALNEWPDNVAAREGLEGCLAAMTQAHLARRDSVGARALFSEMNHPSAELEVWVERLESEIDNEIQEQARLRDMERDMDGATSFKSRLLAYLTVSLLIGASTGGIAWWRGSAGVLTHMQLVGGALFVLLATTALFVLNRRRLFVNAASKRGAGVFLMVLLLLVLDRLLAWSMHMPVEHVFVLDLMVIVAGSAAAALTLFRWAGSLSLIFLGAAIVASQFPEYAEMTYAVGTTLPVLVYSVFWRRMTSP